MLGRLTCSLYGYFVITHKTSLGIALKIIIHMSNKTDRVSPI